MPAISFQARWRKQLENGLDLVAGRRMRHRGVEPKLQTLRRPRKIPIVVGHPLKLWELQRSPERYFIGDVECLLARPLTLSWRFGHVPIGQSASTPAWRIECDGSPYPVRRLAQLDGFPDAGELVLWMVATYGLLRTASLELVLISWDPRRPWEAV